MFGFGSCGSWSISVRFGSVFGIFCIDICFLSSVGKANTYCFPQEVSCFPQEVSWAAAFKERRELNSENQSFLKLSAHAFFYEETHICFFHWAQKAITTCPISLLGEGKTVPVPQVRFCTRFQRFTVPTVHRLFEFLRFGSTVPVRFQNLIDIIYIYNVYIHTYKNIQESASLRYMSNASTKRSHGSHVDCKAIRRLFDPIGLLPVMEPGTEARRNWTANVFRTKIPSVSHWESMTRGTNDIQLPLQITWKCAGRRWKSLGLLIAWNDDVSDF